jgi:CubicO group peptidase (beta-lactamase class C family)
MLCAEDGAPETRMGEGKRRARRLVAVLKIGLLMGLAGVAACFALLAWGCSSPSRRVRSLKVTLDLVVPPALRLSRAAGVSVAVIDQGKVVLAQGYGVANREAAKVVTEETLFNAGSVSKTVTAFGVMALVEDGTVELDASVGAYLKRWRLPNVGFDNDMVTVRRLLSHTSGLSVYPIGVSFNAYLPGQAMPSLEEALSRPHDHFGKLRLVRKPGTRFEYNNGNYAILELGRPCYAASSAGDLAP